MSEKYNMVLNILLAIVIIAIIVLFGIWLYDIYIKNSIEKDAISAINDFEEAINSGELTQEDIEESIINEIEENVEKPEESSTTTGKNGGTSTGSKSNTFRGFKIAGYIEIPKTKVKLPVLEVVTVKSLKASVAILYGPGLNKTGNTIIVGHNYRNGMFFSNNKKLAVGDKIYITDLNGNKVTYVIYNVYLTSPDDADYMTRTTNGAMEISLSTCTDDSSKRIIIWARAE